MENKTRRNRWLLGSIVIILIATMMPGGAGDLSIKYVDKFVHFGLFLFLSINICYRYHKSEKLIEGIIWAIFFGLMTEYFQQFVPARDMDIDDGIADTLGVIAGYYLYKKSRVSLDKILMRIGA